MRGKGSYSTSLEKEKWLAETIVNVRAPSMLLFAHDEINAVEDTLGQFTGYLCTMFFAKHEPMTESVQQRVVAQEV